MVVVALVQVPALVVGPARARGLVLDIGRVRASDRGLALELAIDLPAAQALAFALVQEELVPDQQGQEGQVAHNQHH